MKGLLGIGITITQIADMVKDDLNIRAIMCVENPNSPSCYHSEHVLDVLITYIFSVERGTLSEIRPETIKNIAQNVNYRSWYQKGNEYSEDVLTSLFFLTENNLVPDYFLYPQTSSNKPSNPYENDPDFAYVQNNWANLVFIGLLLSACYGVWDYVSHKGKGK